MSAPSKCSRVARGFLAIFGMTFVGLPFLFFSEHRRMLAREVKDVWSFMWLPSGGGK